MKFRSPMGGGAAVGPGGGTAVHGPGGNVAVGNVYGGGYRGGAGAVAAAAPYKHPYYQAPCGPPYAPSC
jgi:hypothetical protein